MSTDLEYLEELLTEVKLNPPAIIDSPNDVITTDEIGKTTHCGMRVKSSMFFVYRI